MKTLLLFTLTALIFAGCSKSDHHPANNAPVRIMTYNIKYDNKGDSVESWNARRKAITNLIAFYEPDFLGTQEALYNQVQDIDKLPHFDYVGVGRQDGKQEGEFSALFYNTDHFKLVAGTDSTLWLSKTPEKPSKSWGAAFPRILTWGEFENKASGQKLFVFNTHFDHISAEARSHSAEIITQTVKNVAGDQPAVVMGDFNSLPEDKPHAIMTKDDFLRDSHQLADSIHIGPRFTFGGFEVDPSVEPHRIDYIYVTQGVNVVKHGAISSFSNGYYPSDHIPVISDVEIK